MCKQWCPSKDEEKIIFLKGGEGVYLLGFLFVGWVILCYVGFFLLCFSSAEMGLLILML